MANLQCAVIGGGCFWCIEAVFNRIDGIEKAVSGYAGGGTENPAYEAVCSGTTGHAEVVELTFDPEKISYRQILRIFFSAHDPTSLNRQGSDVGTQYRSVIFCTDQDQLNTAREEKALAARGVSGQVVTEIKELEVFYPAEAYHQLYYEMNTGAGYCRFVIRPKLEKLGLKADSIN